jgi:hypothetical protein
MLGSWVVKRQVFDVSGARAVSASPAGLGNQMLAIQIEWEARSLVVMKVENIKDAGRVEALRVLARIAAHLDIPNRGVVSAQL